MAQPGWGGHALADASVALPPGEAGPAREAPAALGPRVPAAHCQHGHATEPQIQYFGNRAAALELAGRWLDERFEVNYEANFGLGAEVHAEDVETLVKACGRLSVPALVVHGTGDPRPIDGPAELAEVLPRGELAPLDGVGHEPWAEHPGRLRDALRRFLAGLPPAA